MHKVSKYRKLHNKKKRGEIRIEDGPKIAAVVEGPDLKTRRMIEISENLHRAELTELERSRLTAEWVELVGGGISAQLAPKIGRGRPASGLNETARQLGKERTEVQRAVRIASLAPEAQAAEGTQNRL